MMQPWQVWSIDGDELNHLVLIISTEFHLRANVGRLATVVPVTDVERELDYRVPIEHPVSGEPYWVVTDQIRTIASAMNPTGWTLSEDKITQVRRALTHMVDF
jgi:mRNA-degrading endonuclease toxin of MazEF toxin-antitoxin module